MQMTPEERKDLEKWVAAGNSPYENGDWICYEGGGLVDFITAERMMKEQIEWFDSLSYEEQQELLHPEGEDRDVGEVGENTLASDDRELPFWSSAVKHLLLKWAKI